MEKHTDQYLMENHLIEAESIEYLDLPPLRFIGKDVIASGPDAGDAYGRMWGQERFIYAHPGRDARVMHLQLLMPDLWHRQIRPGRICGRQWTPAGHNNQARRAQGSPPS